MTRKLVRPGLFARKSGSKRISARHSTYAQDYRSLQYESLELRLALSAVNAIESFPTLLGERNDETGSRLGASVAIDGEWAVAGAPFDDESGEVGGAAYVYRKQESQWLFETKLVGADIEYGEQFGTSVAIDNETIVVGARTESTHGSNAGAAYVFRYEAGTWTEQAKLVASDAKRDGYFGRAVAVEDEIIVVGAGPSNTFFATNAAAYAFEFTGNAWSETAKLKSTAASLSQEVYYGGSVDINQGRIVVGAGSRRGDDQGAVYIYERSDLGWMNAAKLQPTELVGQHGFGLSVALNANTLVVGSPLVFVPREGPHGEVHTYEYVDDQWSFAQTLVASDPKAYKYFGSSVAIEEGSIVIGAEGDSFHNVPGNAYLFRQSMASTWVEVDHLAALDSRSGDQFGRSVALDGIHLLIGESHQDQDYEYIGAVHPFELVSIDTEVSLLNMEHVRSDLVKLEYAVQGVVPDLPINIYRSTNDYFDSDDLGYLVEGTTVSASDSFGEFLFDPGEFDPTRPYLVAVASTAASEHRTNDNQLALRQIPAIYARESFPNSSSGIDYSDLSDTYGSVIAVDGDRAVVGGSWGESSGEVAHAVYVLEKQNGAWVQTARLVSPETPAARFGPTDAYGKTVAISGDVIAVGASHDNEAGDYAGAVYVYQLIESSWVQQAKLTAADPTSLGLLGRSIAMDGNTIVAGAYSTADSSGGAAYVFQRNNGLWSQEAKLHDDLAGPYFGYDVAIATGHIVVSDIKRPIDRGSSDSTVYLYKLQDDQWMQSTKVISPGETRFGAAVTVKDDIVAIAASYGTTATAYLYRIVDGQLQLETRLSNVDESTENFIPTSIAIDGDFVLLGDSLDEERGSRAGAVYLFQRVGENDWIEHPKILSIDSSPHDKFGEAVVIQDGELLIGAPINIQIAGLSGTIHHFEITSLNADAQLFEMRQLTSRVAKVSYAIQGTASEIQMTVYESADEHFDSGDLSHTVATQSVNASNVVSSLEFETNSFNAARPYLIAVITADVTESSYTNNQAVIERIPPKYAIEQFPTLILQDSDDVDYDAFGYSIAVDGNRAVIGAPGAELHAGAAYIMERVDGSWIQQSRITAPVEVGYRFGSSVAITGDTIVVGAAGPTGAPHEGGSAFVFSYSASNWSLTQELHSSDARLSDGFGTTVAIDGNTIVVSAKANGRSNSDRQESVYIFELINEQWTEVASFDGPDRYPYSSFGHSIAVDGESVIVGVPYLDNAYLYERLEGTWQETAILSATNEDNGNGFGSAVDIELGTMVIAASSSQTAHVYQRENDEWDLQEIIRPSATNSDYGFGESVSIHGDSIVVGVFYENPYSLPDSLGAYLFRRSSDGTWLEHEVLAPLGRLPDGGFGHAVAVHNNHILVGSPFHDEPANNAGAVFAYEISSINADIDLYSMEQLADGQMVISYAANGLSVPAQLLIYRSTDAFFDPSDLSHPIASTSLAPLNELGTFSFSPGMGDEARPYVVAVAVTDEPEHSLTNNQYIIRETSADFDSDGDVDGADFLAWQRGFGSSGDAIRSDGDADGDGDVGLTDLDAWQATYSLSEPIALASIVNSESSTTVPETTKLVEAFVMKLSGIVQHTRPNFRPQAYAKPTDSAILFDKALVELGVVRRYAVDQTVQAVSAGQERPNDLLTNVPDEDNGASPWVRDELLEAVFGEDT